MKTEEHRDRLVDLLLCELVARESPPDVRARVLAAAGEAPRPATFRPRPVATLGSLRKSRSSKLPALAIAAAVALLGVAGVLLHFQRVSAARTPVVTAVSGSVNRSTGPIRPGERLRTGSLSSAVLGYRDGSKVELGPDTIMVVPEVSQWDGSKRIELVTGVLQAEVQPQPSGRRMVLVSRDARAEVVGTMLSFRCDDVGTRLEVTEGAVRFVPGAGSPAVVVESGVFAESGKSGFRTGSIGGSPVRGITGFTLMNAESDRPLRDRPLVDGETISLSSLPTRKINIRADYEGEAPAIVRLMVTRRDGTDTGLPPHVFKDQKHPPFFVAGDFWPEGRPNDCREWTPKPGFYQIVGEAAYADNDGKPGKPLKIGFRITE